MPEIASASFEVVELPLDVVHAASWNANRVPKDVLAKVRRSMREFGILENSVVRTLPQPCPYCKLATETPHFEVVSGNHRRGLYESEGRATMPCVIRELTDGQARILADALNNTRGKNDPDAERRAIIEALEEVDIEYAASLLPYDEEAIRKIIADVPNAGDAPVYGGAQLFGVVVEVESEAEQAGLIEQLQELGYDNVRALLL